MSNPPLVSVIIPAFNAARFLAQTLQSVRDQTHSHFEAIVVDDGSSDETAAIGKRFAAQDARFTLLQQENAGSCAARNVALERARGDWIAYLDAADFWFPQKLERQLGLAAQDAKANLLFTNYYIWDGQSDLGLRYPKGRKIP